MSQTVELFSPKLSVSIGGYTFSKGIEVESYSAQTSYFDWSKIRFTEEFQPKVSFAAGDIAQISLGYNGELEAVFQGYVSKGYNAGSSLNEILLKDDMLKLERTNITETFLNATPQEIISFALSKAGISSFALSQTSYPIKIFPVSKKSVIALLQEINSVWGISIKFFFRGGRFYWGTAPAQKSVYEFAYAQNIIDLTRESGAWKLVTVSVPFIHHSDIIRVNHPSVTGEFEVSKVVFTTDTTGFIRTYLYF
jgi:hypothetical protein|nr:MAG TPA: tail protein [Caudoviricetes sp.]